MRKNVIAVEFHLLLAMILVCALEPSLVLLLILILISFRDIAITILCAIFDNFLSFIRLFIHSYDGN